MQKKIWRGEFDWTVPELWGEGKGLMVDLTAVLAERESGGKDGNWRKCNYFEESEDIFKTTRKQKYTQ